MLMCIQNLVKFCPLVLKILSGNEMVTDLRNYGMTELRNDGRTRQIQYSPTFSKRGYIAPLFQSGAIIKELHLKIRVFTAFKNICIMHGNVCVMNASMRRISRIHYKRRSGGGDQES